jgi:uncharacterized protein (DUF1330 family)
MRLPFSSSFMKPARAALFMIMHHSKYPSHPSMPVAIQDVLRRFGGRYVIRAGRSETMEGELRSRLVAIEFKDHETALACYRSPEYGRVKKLREHCAQADLVVVEGYDGAQPGD